MALDAGHVAPAQAFATGAPSFQGAAVGAQALQVQAPSLAKQCLVGLAGQGGQQQGDGEGEGEKAMHQGRGSSIGRSSRRMSPAWARPSRRTQAWPGARRRKLTGVWLILSGR